MVVPITVGTIGVWLVNGDLLGCHCSGSGLDSRWGFTGRDPHDGGEGHGVSNDDTLLEPFLDGSSQGTTSQNGGEDD